MKPDIPQTYKTNYTETASVQCEKAQGKPHHSLWQQARRGKAEFYIYHWDRCPESQKNHSNRNKQLSKALSAKQGLYLSTIPSRVRKGIILIPAREMLLSLDFPQQIEEPGTEKYCSSCFNVKNFIIFRQVYVK